jgi:hypothetical protein
MNKHDFWITCPSCQKKFSVSHEIIRKYLHRVMGAAVQHLTQEADRIFKAKQAPPPKNLPT